MIRECLTGLSSAEIGWLEKAIAEYLDYRRTLADFWTAHFRDICSEKCFQSGLSACCSKDGIIVFFADAVVNALVSDAAALDRLETAIRQPARPDKCIFLTAAGCLWTVKPVVCELFLCDSVKEKVFFDQPEARQTWEHLRKSKKRYTWPDQPVLFEYLESFFLDKGYQSSLMHIHFSPGLRRIKQQREDGAQPNREADHLPEKNIRQAGGRKLT